MRDHSELTLRNQKDFNNVYNRGNSQGSKFVVVLYKKNDTGTTRTAFVASKKVGNSVVRNRARRLMKESYRNFSKKVVQGYDIIFVARNTLHDIKEDDVRRAMYGAVRAAGLFN